MRGDYFDIPTVPFGFYATSRHCIPRLSPRNSNSAKRSVVAFSYVRCLLLRSTFAATAPASAVSELWVVRRFFTRPMLTSVQLFHYDRKLTACALGEPSLALVRNDSEFGLLISGGAHEDSFTARFYLDEVSYLRVVGEHWSYTDFDSVAIFQHEGVWLAQDTDSGRYFPNPSHSPYHVVFVTHAEFQRIQHSRAEGLAFPVFESAQQHFGRLPGFSFRAKSLEAPADYANRNDAVPRSEYVLTTQSA